MISCPKADTSFHFINNDYFTTSNALNLEWANKTYTTLLDWRKDTNQEIYNREETGFTTDPKFKNPGKGIILNNTDSLFRLTAYSLNNNSPLINKGLKISAMFNLPDAVWDFNKEKIPVGNNPEPGACEFLPDKN